MPTKQKKRGRTDALIICIVLLLGITLGWHISTLFHKAYSSTVSGNQVRADLAQYKFINPSLFSDNQKSKDLYYTSLQSLLSSTANAYIKENDAQGVSIYFRDMNGAQWTGYNEDALYTPSSMLKVVAMMAALKLAETDPSILDTKLYFHRSSPQTEYFKPDDDLGNGNYSVRDLIGVMIKNSDNDAFYALVGNKEINDEFVQLYNILRLPSSGLNGETQNFMSPKSYAVIFRTLYNSSLFEWNLSEQILDLLSQTTFTEGLVAGVPKGIVVAHKFGENTNELHDCGIVYYPKHPYLLCIMTRGNDLTSLEQVISGISKTVYDYTNSNYHD